MAFVSYHLKSTKVTVLAESPVFSHYVCSAADMSEAGVTPFSSSQPYIHSEDFSVSLLIFISIIVIQYFSMFFVHVGSLSQTGQPLLRPLLNGTGHTQ